jgi:hypothetical protein
MTEFEGNLPPQERLSLRERLAQLGRNVLHALARDTEAFTERPSYDQYVADGVEDLQKFLDGSLD